MRKFKVTCMPIRQSYEQKNGRVMYIPLQDWTQEEVDDYLKRYNAAFRRRARTQKQR